MLDYYLLNKIDDNVFLSEKYINFEKEMLSQPPTPEEKLLIDKAGHLPKYSTTFRKKWEESPLNPYDDYILFRRLTKPENCYFPAKFTRAKIPLFVIYILYSRSFLLDKYEKEIATKLNIKFNTNINQTLVKGLRQAAAKCKRNNFSIFCADWKRKDFSTTALKAVNKLEIQGAIPC